MRYMILQTMSPYQISGHKTRIKL